MAKARATMGGPIFESRTPCNAELFNARPYKRALRTQLGDSLRQPPFERRIFKQEEAISFAAYRAAIDLFPGDKATVFDPLMQSLGYDFTRGQPIKSWGGPFRH